MTDVDKREFVQAFNRLAVATRLTEADATMQRVYFQGLSEYPLEAVVSAANSLALSSTWFPKLAEWRGSARIAVVATMKALPSDRERPWEEECNTCLDTGWEERRCYPGTTNNCGRHKCGGSSERAEHRYAVPCACRPTNRTYARHHTGNKADYSERM